MVCLRFRKVHIEIPDKTNRAEHFIKKARVSKAQLKRQQDIDVQWDFS